MNCNTEHDEKFTKDFRNAITAIQLVIVAMAMIFLALVATVLH